FLQEPSDCVPFMARNVANTYRSQTTFTRTSNLTHSTTLNTRQTILSAQLSDVRILFIRRRALMFSIWIPSVFILHSALSILHCFRPPSSFCTLNSTLCTALRSLSSFKLDSVLNLNSAL